jgi:beta-glucosidase
VDSAEVDLAALLGRLTLEQKVRLLTGADFWSLPPEPAIGLRAVVLSDGPSGVRGRAWDERDTSASLPCGTAIAASWDDGLAERIGALLASQARGKGVDVVLAPTVNLHRSPLGGRHFECMSEDPLLTARIGTAYVRGLQAAGVAATAKHYVANDAETDRFSVDVRVDERTLREVYLAPFERMVTEGGAWLVMAAYNSVNGVTMTEHDLLIRPLKEDWGFDGVVVSDWTAARSTDGTGRAGLDLVMPGPHGPWGADLVEAVRAGRVPESAVDEKVRRLIRLAARVGALDGVAPAAPVPVPPPRPAVGTLLRRAAAAGMVLLSNVDNVLPLDPARLRRVAVLGPNAAPGRGQGGGSAGVLADYLISPLDGLRAALEPEVRVEYALGAAAGYGLEALTAAQVSHPDSGERGLRVRFCDREGTPLREEHRTGGRLIWLGDEILTRAATLEVAGRLRLDEGGPVRVGLAGIGAFRLTAGDRVLVDEVVMPEGTDLGAAFLNPPQRSAVLDLTAGEAVDLVLTYELVGLPAVTVLLGVERVPRPDEEELAAAVAVARAADAAIVVVGTSEREESEGVDRTGLALPGRQDDLVRAVAAANPRTLVVVNSGAPVALPWREEVAAVLLTWFPGQEFGNALADVLLGIVEPGGRLPTTWGATEAEVPVLATAPVDGRLDYAEGIHVGYRAWLRHRAAPAYWFGHGLGYTTWVFEAMRLREPAADGTGGGVRVRLRNTGGRLGREVVQAYLARPDSIVERPRQWLAGYTAVWAEPGETVEVEVALEPAAWRYWSAETGTWAVEPGEYVLAVGRSVVDLPLTGWISLTSD